MSTSNPQKEATSKYEHNSTVFLIKRSLGQKLRNINLVVQALFSALSLANQTWIKLYKIQPIRRSEYKISKHVNGFQKYEID